VPFYLAPFHNLNVGTIGKGTASQVAEKLASTHYNGAEFPVVQDREGHGFTGC
jgi:hypothetical protein